MDSSRTPLSPGAGGKRRRTPPTTEYAIPSTHQSQTSLPSFKQLEPYLRPQHMSTTDHPPSYPYAGASHYAPLTAQQQQQESSASSSQIMGAPQRESAIYGAGDSEADEAGVHSPPKKKRRRQALSCTGDYFTLLVWCALPLTLLLFLGPLDLFILRWWLSANHDMLPLTLWLASVRVQTTKDKVR